jgi:anaerobic ribonucleoside-triphosphate reductase activating protein
LNILATQYTLTRKAFEIYVAGCKGDDKLGHCPNCHNPESWNFSLGDKYDKEYFENIKNKVTEFDDLIQSIQLFGGEINDQNHIEVEQLLRDLKTLNKPIWLFTRYDLKECPKFELELCDYIKTGKYIEDLSCMNNKQYGIQLATSNQQIYKKGVDY